MGRPHRVLTVLLLTLLQVGLLPVRTAFGGAQQSMGEERCGCCTSELAEACCCGGEEIPVQPGGCPCIEVQHAPVLPALPPRPDGGRPELSGAVVGLAAPALGQVIPERREERTQAFARRPLSRAGPPLYRLYAVDRR